MSLIRRLATIPRTIGLVVSLLIYLGFVQYVSPFVPDDSFISFRYAEHLASGSGITFNPGENPVEGYSNFLWIVICAIFPYFGLDTLYWSVRLGIALGMTSIILLWYVLSIQGHNAATIFASLLLLVLSGPFLIYAPSGLEFSLYSFLLITIIVIAEHNIRKPTLIRFVLLALIGVLLSMCRPEGILVYPVIAIYLALSLGFNRLGDSSPKLWIQIAVGSILFTLIIFSYHAWRVSYFGELLPTPFISKGAYGSSLASAVSENVTHYFVQQTRAFAPTGMYFLVLLILSFSAIISSVKRVRDLLGNTTVMTTLLVTLYLGIYLVFTDWMPGMRYHAQLMPLFAMCAANYFASLLPELPARSSIEDLSHRIVIGSTLVGISLFCIAQVKIDANVTQNATVNSLVPLGIWLRDNVPDNAILAISDVGAVPYYSKMRTIDINPRSLTDIYLARHGWSSEYVFGRKPDILVFVSFSIESPRFFGEFMTMYEDREFAEHYKLIGISRYWYLRDRSYWVYARRALSFRPTQLASFPKGVGR